MKLLLALALALSAVAQSPAADPTTGAPAAKPDTILVHGVILTGAHLLPGDTSPVPARVTAVAIRAGRVLAVGSDSNMLALKTPQTNVIDLAGAFAMPGFNDAHTHMAYAGQQHLTLDLDNVTSLAEMTARVAAYAATLAPGAWIQGGGWDHTKWVSKTLPTRLDLDAVSGGHPAFLTRTDGHIGVANTAALTAAGITSATPVPPGSHIDLDATGSPTGIVREDAAMALVTAHIPRPDTAVRRRALQLSIDDALAHGVTSVQDNSEWDDFLVLEQLEYDHQLPLRFSEWLAFADPVDVLKAHRAAHALDDPLLHTTMLKGFMDGSLGSRTAALAAPYADDPGNSGLARYEQAKLDAMTVERAEAGFQIGFHAIGDRANSMALNAFAAARAARTKELQSLLPQLKAKGENHIVVEDESRFRIEHAQVLLPADFNRFASLGVIASMQPSHLLTDMAWAAARLGPERVKYAYAWRSMLDHHVALAFGTDYPVEAITPFRGLYAAVTRQNEAGSDKFQLQEKLTIHEAIYAYTQGSAFAERAEKLKGRIEPGFFADIVVLDRDITVSTPQDLLRTQVLRTIVNGDTVYLAPK